MNFDPGNHYKVSYLRARDPSILAWGPFKCNKNLAHLMESTAIEEEEHEYENEKVQVYLRLKNDDLTDIYAHTNNKLTCTIPETSASFKKLQSGRLLRTFTFSRIFPPNSKQKDIFEYVVKPRVLNFINGHSATVLTYGASGAGKTYTIVGTPVEPGIIPRVLEYLYRTLPKIEKDPKIKPLDNGKYVWLNDSNSKIEGDIINTFLNRSSQDSTTCHVSTYRSMQKRLSNEPVAIMEDVPALSLGVWVSFAEIYNEQVFDLLEWEPLDNNKRTKLRICNNKGATFIQGLKNVYVSSGVAAYQLLQLGINNLNYAATSINSHSSRSHCIFTIKIIQAHSEEEVVMKHFNFCDLAGSERSKKTNNKGERLKESNNINTSLSVLGKCIKFLRDSQKNNEKKLIPFRESKLTLLFQRALTGFEDIAMIVNVNPIKSMFDESLQVLNFSAIAKDVSLEAPPEKKLVDCASIGEENERLREELALVYEKLKDTELRCVEIEEECRRTLVEEFKAIMDDEKRYWSNRLREVEEERDDLAKENDELKDQIERPLAKRHRPDTSVLNEKLDNSRLEKLDSSLEKLDSSSAESAESSEVICLDSTGESEHNFNQEIDGKDVNSEC